MRTGTAARAVLCCALVGAAALAAAPEPAAAASPGAPPITRSAHVTFENCNARNIVLSVAVRRRAFMPQEPVAVTVRLRNTGSATCGAPVPRGVSPARQNLTVGPCGTLSLMVRNARGANIYPGPAPFCPMETGFRLGPHSTVQTTGSWTQTAYKAVNGTWKTASPPPGRYRLVVDGAVTVPFTVAPS